MNGHFMRALRWPLAALGCVLAGSVGLAQVGRGGTRWFAPLADAQRTSWVRVDDKISVDAIAGTGFGLQWKAALGPAAGVTGGFAQGVTASGVTLFVPMSVVTGAGDRVYGLDNDIAFVVWQRALDIEDGATLPACAGAATAAATRVVPLDASATANPLARPAGPPGVGYRTQIGRPGEGAPVDTVRRQAQAAARPTTPAPGASSAASPSAGGVPSTAAGPSPAPATTPAASATAATRPAGFIPGAPRPDESNMRSTLSRPSGVVYVIARDGRLRVLGLASGKDLQRPAQFLPRGARWTAPVAVDTTLYAATTSACGGTPDAVWAIDLDSESKPVVSWKTNGGPVVGPVAVTSTGMLLAAVGAGAITADGKANAIVALDPKTLEVKDWFTRPDADFATGPSIFRHGDREVVAAATRDGRVIVLDAASLGGADHATPLASSTPTAGAGGSVRRDAIALWQQGAGVVTSAGSAASAAAAPTTAAATPAATTASGDPTTWILVPVDGPVAAQVPRTSAAASRGAIVALAVRDSAGALSIEPAWTAASLNAPATPLVVNGVVFALGAGSPGKGAVAGTGATLHAYDGATGRRLWTSGRAMTAPASPGSLWSGLGQVYVGTEDGTLHAFGFDDERYAIPKR
jgi:hypothetical protein